MVPCPSRLHLSGNGITGSLPDTNFGGMLSDLSLTHNLLHGNILASIQTRNWTTLDLSTNRFGGTLNNDFSHNNQQVVLTGNRLSGYVPSVMIQMKNISILRGTCSTDRYDLPRNDDEVDKFQCGSNSFEVMYYIWLGILVTPILLFLLLWLFRDSIALSCCIDVSSIISTTMKYWNVRQYIDQSRDVSMMKNFRNYLNFSDQILRFTLVFSLYIIIVLLPTYAILGSYMNRVSYSYAWLFSIAFQSGRLSFVILMTLLTLLIIALIPVCESFFVTDHDIIAFRSFSSSMVLHYDPRKDVGSYRKLKCIWCVYLLSLFASIIFMIGAFVSYVYVTLYQCNNIILSSQGFLDSYHPSYDVT